LVLLCICRLDGTSVHRWVPARIVRITVGIAYILEVCAVGWSR